MAWRRRHPAAFSGADGLNAQGRDAGKELAQDFQLVTPETLEPIS
jgi:hypothetical protein